MPVHRHSPQTIESHFGRLDVDRRVCKPLERVELRISGRDGGDAHCLVRVCDPLQRQYAELPVELVGNHGELYLLATFRLTPCISTAFGCAIGSMV